MFVGPVVAVAFVEAANRADKIDLAAANGIRRDGGIDDAGVAEIDDATDRRDRSETVSTPDIDWTSIDCFDDGVAVVAVDPSDDDTTEYHSHDRRP